MKQIPRKNKNLQWQYGNVLEDAKSSKHLVDGGWGPSAEEDSPCLDHPLLDSSAAHLDH
jgi:hypothetical protein